MMTRDHTLASRSALSLCVAQLGARMHYAVPRTLYAAGMVERLFTDATGTSSCARALRVIPERLRPTGLKRLLGRVPVGVPLERISAFERFGWEYAWRCWRARDQEEQTRVYLWAGRRFCQLILAAGLGKAAGVYTFNSAGLELLEHAKRLGLFGMLEQTIAPAQVEDRLLAAEMDSNPGWERPAKRGRARGEFAAREQAEWECADLVLCGSEFVRRGIGECGGPVERCVVVPYGVAAAELTPEPRQGSGPLRVLICGAVTLRKGAPYALRAARALRGAAEFRWVGSMCLLSDAASRLGEHIDLCGAVPRTAMTSRYAWADVFLLPSICEGSATVCYEALAAGLPVITTPNAGSVVREGLDGFVVPVRNPEAIAVKLELLARDRELLRWMSKNARGRAREFTVEKYGERLIAALRAAWPSNTRALQYA
jgi:hypothetical protein